jgi:sulfur carrier protein
MIVTVNGAPRELEPGATVASVVAMLALAPEARGVAVALDGDVVARSRWAQTTVVEGALVEIVAAIQGG